LPLPGVFETTFTHSLLAFPICQEGVVLALSIMLYFAGSGVVNGSSLSCFTIF
jgi:hypothetical protein